MTEHPVIFTAHSVNAILANHKTQSRRIVNFDKLRAKMLCRVNSGPFCDHPLVAKRGKSYPVGLNPHGAVFARINDDKLGLKPGEFDFIGCPYISGETHLADFGRGEKEWVIEPFGPCRLWVKESWAVPGTVARSDDPVRKGMKVVYRANDDAAHSWRSPLFMPRWASRINLEVQSVRLERLQDITEEDARAEGVMDDDICRVWRVPSARDAYAMLWDQINGDKAPWSTSPWVWVLRFRREESTALAVRGQPRAP